jgi:hypothetical protein
VWNAATQVCFPGAPRGGTVIAARTISPTNPRSHPLPRGYVLVGQTVDVTRGTRGGNAKSAGAALSFRCPGTKTLRTFGVVGNAGFTAPTDYVRHRQTRVFSFAPPSLDHATGTLYAVCR